MVLTMQHSERNPSVLQIRGGNPLKGEVRISGSKNAVLPIMAAALLAADDCQIRNVPRLDDVTQMVQILKYLGVAVKHQKDVLTLNTTCLTGVKAPAAAVQKLRAGFLVLAPLLARMGIAQVPLPGGCAIGSRPVDLHLRGLEAMGATIQIREGVVHASLDRFDRLQGARIKLDFPSVGATETLILAAVTADGETVIENAAQEPEVVDLVRFCQSMGAKIAGAGTRRIVISGVSCLHGTDHHVIPDRIEAGTFLIAAAITRSPFTLTAVNPNHLRNVVEELWSVGAQIQSKSVHSTGAMADNYRLHITPARHFNGRTILTRPYPGFPTDMQPQFMALLSTAEDSSFIVETLFENRFQHVLELNRMGANIEIQRKQALILGNAKLVGTTVTATDLRVAAALVLASLAAEGTTTIYNLHFLDRGYEDLESKLRQLGAVVERVNSAPTPVAELTIATPERVATSQKRSNQRVAVRVV